MSRSAAPALLLALCLLPALAAAQAESQTWTVLVGSLADAETGERRPLTGSFEAVAHPTLDAQAPWLGVEDFALVAGDHTLVSGEPPQFDVFAGGHPLWARVADGVVVEGDAVPLLYLRSGDALIAETQEDVTLRFLALQGIGRAVGGIGEEALPRRIEVMGTLHAVEEDLHADEACLSAPSLGGGGVILDSGGISAGGTLVSGSGSLSLRRAPTLDAGSGVLSTRVSDGGSGVLASTASASPTPTLEALGITAAEGAEVTYLDGALRVTSTGDLILHGATLDLPGLTSVTISTAGHLFIEAMLEVPEGVTIALETGGSPEIDPDDDLVIELPPVSIDPIPQCHWLVSKVATRKHLLGRFSFVATAAQPVEVDLLPARERTRLTPGAAQAISAALLGSDAFDVRDVVPSSLRLGEAPPLPTGRAWRAPRDVDRDGHRDLVARFDLRETGLAWNDTVLCLLAETADGTLLEGCDAVDPDPRGRAPRGAPSRLR